MKNITERNRGIFEMIAAMVLMGTVGYFVVESGLSAHVVVFYRCLFGSLFLALFCFMRGYFMSTGLSRGTILIAILSGIFLVCNWIMLFASFKFASISTSTVIYHTQPLFFVAMGAVFLKDSVSFNKTVWIVLAFIGVVLVVDAEMDSLSLSSSHLIGVMLAISAAIFYAITSTMVKHLKMIKPHLTALIQVSVGSVILLPFADLDSTSSIYGLQWGYLLVLGGVHTCLTYILMYSAFQKLPTPLIAVLSFIYPAVAILVDYIFYDKVLHGLQFVGVLLILFSSFAVNQNLPIFLRPKAKTTASGGSQAP